MDSLSHAAHNPAAAPVLQAGTEGTGVELAAQRNAAQPADSPKVAALRQGIIPESLRRDLKIIPENDPASIALCSRVRQALQEYLPGLDQRVHPVHILLGDNSEVPGARLKYMPETTIILGREKVLSCKTEAELMLLVLHELTHALLAKGYRPHELFDIAGIDRFKTLPEREANTPDKDKPSVGKLEEGGAHTLPLLLIAEAGKDPRIYGTYFESLFAEQREARTRGNWAILQEIIDEHPLPEVTEGLAEAASVVFLNARGALPTAAGVALTELHKALKDAHYVTQVEAAADRTKIDRSSIAERIKCARDFAAEKGKLSREDIKEIRELLDAPGVRADSVPQDLAAAHELAEFLVQAGGGVAYDSLCRLIDSERPRTVVLGKSLCGLVSAIKDLEAALGADERGHGGAALDSRLDAISEKVQALATAYNEMHGHRNGDQFARFATSAAKPFSDFQARPGQLVPWQLLFDGICSPRPDFMTFRTAALALGCNSDARFAEDEYSKDLLYVAANGIIFEPSAAAAPVAAALMMARARMEREVVGSSNPEATFGKYAGRFYRIHNVISVLPLKSGFYATPEALPSLFDSRPALWARANGHHSSPPYLRGGAVIKLLNWLGDQGDLNAPAVVAHLEKVLSHATVTVVRDNIARFEALIERCVAAKAKRVIELLISKSELELPDDKRARIIAKAASVFLEDFAPKGPKLEKERSVGEVKKVKASLEYIRAAAKASLAYVDADGQLKPNCPTWVHAIFNGPWMEAGLSAAKKKAGSGISFSTRELLALSEIIDDSAVERLLSPFAPGRGFSQLPLEKRCQVCKRLSESGALGTEKRNDILLNILSELELPETPNTVKEKGSAVLLSLSQSMPLLVSRRVENVWVQAVSDRLGKDPEGSAGATLDDVGVHHAELQATLDAARKEFPRQCFISVVSKLAKQIELQTEMSEWVRGSITSFTAKEIEGFGRGWKVAEAIILMTRHDIRERERLLDFLLAPGAGDYHYDEFRADAAEQVREYLQMTGRERRSLESLASEVRTFHDNFWAYRPEQRALAVRQLFRVTPEQMARRGGREQIQLDGNTFSYVAKRLFPGEDAVSEQARVTVRAYADALDPIEQPFVLSGLLFAARNIAATSNTRLQRRALALDKVGQEDPNLQRIGEAVAQFVSARDPGLQKLGQVLAGLPGVPEEIRRPNRALLDNAAPMERWDQVRLARHIEPRLTQKLAEKEPARVSISRVGAGLGDGTMASTVTVDLSNGITAALTLRKPFALERGQAGLSVVQKAAEAPALRRTYPKIAETMAELVADASARLVPEADYSLTAAQYAALDGMFGGRSIALGAQRVETSVAQCLVCDHDFALTELIKGQTLAALQRKGEVPHFLQAGRAVQVMSAILHLNFDTDRSAGNVMVQGARSIELDPKAIMLERRADGAPERMSWTSTDAQLFGRLMGRVLLGIDTTGTNGKFLQLYISAVDELRAQESKAGRKLPLLVREANKAILTASGLLEAPKGSPYTTGFILYSILRNGMQDDVARGVCEELLSDRGVATFATRAKLPQDQIRMFGSLLKPHLEQFLKTGDVPPMAAPLLMQLIPQLASAAALPEPIKVSPRIV
ncbi:MAG: hypothetical protein K1X79_00225 [Oligoflexia bacterium]|nr:hypothetical protein [Oligoflexia bacterium]